MSLNELPSPLICSAVLSNGRFLSSTFFYPISSTFYFLGNIFSFNLTTRGTSLAITKFWTMFLQVTLIQKKDRGNGELVG
jgi:hypothetical protein